MHEHKFHAPFTFGKTLNGDDDRDDDDDGDDEDDGDDSDDEDEEDDLKYW